MIGRVYKIIVNCSNECYVGSTFQECRARWQEHKNSFNRNKKRLGEKSSELFEKYGIENCKIILIKEYEVVDRKHLEAYEQLWINKLKSINKYNLIYIKKMKKKIDYQNTLKKNPNFLKELYQKQLQKNPNYNKESYTKKLQKNPNYNKERYEKIKEKITCECGSELLKHNLTIHQRRKKHQQFLQQIRPVQ